MSVVALAAIAVAFGTPLLWRITAASNIQGDVRLGTRSNGYPVTNAICFHDKRARVVVLHRATSAEHDPGPVYRQPSEYPAWLDDRSFGEGVVFDCLIDGKRVYIDDGVQIYFAVDDAPPKRVRIEYKDYASWDTAVFLHSNEAIWDLCMRFTIQEQNNAVHTEDGMRSSQTEYQPAVPGDG